MNIARPLAQSTSMHALSWLASAATHEGQFIASNEVHEYLAETNARHPIHVEQVPLDQLADWNFLEAPLRLAHTSGRFFSIDGLHTATDFGPVHGWYQPIINQPEIGILGIITKVFHGLRYFLMQVKIEPGNVNGAQLSPSLQATRSNFKQVHRGRRPRYLEYFTGEAPAAILVDQLQSEQGSRFLGKRNRNMIVEVHGPLEIHEGFHWMTLGQIKGLLRCENLVNMDARSVISCIPLPMCDLGFAPSRLAPFGGSLVESSRVETACRHSTAAVISWLSRLRSSHTRTTERRGLDQLGDWEIAGGVIRHTQGRYFSVIGVNVQIDGREVERWNQPLLRHAGIGLNGLIAQKIHGTLHFLVRACMYPGNRDVFEIGSTVSRSDYIDQFGRPDAPPFLNLFEDPPSSLVRFDCLQSEEGGRFYHYVNRYMILELPPDEIDEVPEEFLWMTFFQLNELLPHGYLNIEMRNLLACLSVV